MDKQLTFFGFVLADVGEQTGWTPGNKYEAVLAPYSRMTPLRFTVERHDDGKRWSAKLAQARADGVSFVITGDALGPLIEQCEDRVRELRTQLEALTAPRS